MCLNQRIFVNLFLAVLLWKSFHTLSSMIDKRFHFILVSSSSILQSPSAYRWIEAKYKIVVIFFSNTLYWTLNLDSCRVCIFSTLCMYIRYIRVCICYIRFLFLVYIDITLLTRKPMARGIFESNWMELNWEKKEKKNTNRAIEPRWRSVISRRRARCQQRTIADSFDCVNVYRQSFVMHWHTLFLFSCKPEKCVYRLLQPFLFNFCFSSLNPNTLIFNSIISFSQIKANSLTMWASWNEYDWILIITFSSF